jgi:hypothetical protein
MILSFRAVTVFSILLSVLSVGCTPRVRVRKSPSPQDTGFRYYRPKPYLLISPGAASIAVAEGDKKTTTTVPSDEYVTIQMQYLPDFSEEYAIDVRPGFGVAEVSFKLENGWNLTEVNQKLDSKTAENIAATAELLKSAGSLIPTGNAAADDKNSDAATQRWVVRATNVPLGYYESVVSRNNTGKGLAGWRYVGFAPFNSCPTKICGAETVDCADHNGPIYGLGFVEGVMTFQQLDLMQSNQFPSQRVAVPFGTTGKRTDREVDAKESANQISKLAGELFLRESGSTALDVTVEDSIDPLSKFQVTIFVTPDDFDQNQYVNLAGKITEEIKKQTGVIVLTTIRMRSTQPQPSEDLPPFRSAGG